MKLCKPPKQGLENVIFLPPKESSKDPQSSQKMHFPAGTAKSFVLSSSQKSEKAAASPAKLLEFFSVGEDVAPETVLEFSLVCSFKNAQENLKREVPVGLWARNGNALGVSNDSQCPDLWDMK